MKNTIFLLLTLCVLCQCSCKKSLLTDDDDTMTPMTELERLPPITSEGANTFGCLVNGEAWTPKGFSFPESNFDVYYDEVYFNGLNIDMFKKVDTIDQNVFFGIKMIGNTTQIDFIQAASFRGFQNCDFYELILSSDVEITKLDTINKIVSGIFEFDLLNENGCTDTLRVTSGRFDAIYRY